MVYSSLVASNVYVSCGGVSGVGFGLLVVGGLGFNVCFVGLWLGVKEA